MKVLEGHLRSEGLRACIVVSRTNAFIVERLLEGALDAFRRTGCRDEDIEVIRVPGAFEIPEVARAVVGKGDRQAVVCLGLVLRGGTPHFDYVASVSIRGVAEVALHGFQRGIVVTMGILTCDTLEQAIERAGNKGGNKGFEAAMAAIELADLRRQMGMQMEDAPALTRVK